MKSLNKFDQNDNDSKSKDWIIADDRVKTFLVINQQVSRLKYRDYKIARWRFWNMSL